MTNTHSDDLAARLRDVGFGSDTNLRLAAADHIERLEERCEAYKEQGKDDSILIESLKRDLKRYMLSYAEANQEADTLARALEGYDHFLLHYLDGLLTATGTVHEMRSLRFMPSIQSALTIATRRINGET